MSSANNGYTLYIHNHISIIISHQTSAISNYDSSTASTTTVVFNQLHQKDEYDICFKKTELKTLSSANNGYTLYIHNHISIIIPHQTFANSNEGSATAIPHRGI